jgi:thiamine pyrophosphate-dependent acetolactate synthase large subunit-like protein
MELTTAVKYGMAVKHVLLDNHALGKIAKEQRAGDFPVWQHLAGQPGLGEVRPALRATGIRVDRREQLDAAMAELFTVDGPPCCTTRPPAWLSSGDRLSVRLMNTTRRPS